MDKFDPKDKQILSFMFFFLVYKRNSFYDFLFAVSYTIHLGRGIFSTRHELAPSGRVNPNDNGSKSFFTELPSLQGFQISSREQQANVFKIGLPSLAVLPFQLILRHLTRKKTIPQELTRCCYCST